MDTHPSGFPTNIVALMKFMLSSAKTVNALHVFAFAPHCGQSFGITWFLALYLKRNYCAGASVLLVSESESALRMNVEMISRHMGLQVKISNISRMKTDKISTYYHAVCIGLNGAERSLWQISPIPETVDIVFASKMRHIDVAALNDLASKASQTAWTVTCHPHSYVGIGLDNAVVYNFISPHLRIKV